MKRIKPVKGWGIVDKNGKLWFFGRATSKQLARIYVSPGRRLVRVTVTVDERKR